MNFTYLKTVQEKYKTVKNFKFNSINRDVRNFHISSIKADLFIPGKDDQYGSWVGMQPIIVNKRTMQILDGQHRWQLWMNCIANGLISPDSTIIVQYVDCDEKDEINWIQTLQDGQSWTGNDMIDSNAKKGDENYIDLQKWCDEHTLCHWSSKTGRYIRRYRAAVAMMTGKRCEKDLTSGKFVFTPESNQMGDEVHKELMDILSILGLSENIGKCGLEGMAQAWYSCRSLHTFPEWKKGIKKDQNWCSQISNAGSRSWNSYFDRVSGKLFKTSLKEKSASV